MSNPGRRTALVTRYEALFGPVDRAAVAHGGWLFLAGVALVVAGSLTSQDVGDAFALFLPLAYPSPFYDVLPRLLQGWGYAAVLAGAVLRLPVGRWTRRLVAAALVVALASIGLGADVTGDLPWRSLQWVYVGAVAVLVLVALAAPRSPPSSVGHVTDGSTGRRWLAPATGRRLSVAGLATVIVGLVVFLSASPTSSEPLSLRLTLGIQLLQLGAGAFVAGVLLTLPVRRWAREVALLGVGLAAVGVGVTATVYALDVVASVRLPEPLAVPVAVGPFVGLVLVTLLALFAPWLGDAGARRPPVAAEEP